MKISKISRRLVVAIFVAFIMFLSFLDFKLLLDNEVSKNSFSINIVKLIYVVILIILVLVYVYIKDKLNKLKIKRAVAFVYRYIYMILAVIITSLVSLYKSFDGFSNFILFSYVILTLAISMIIKRIIFNVSKSDILSVLAMFLYSMRIYPFDNSNLMIASLIISLSFFATLLMMQILIDELKQRGVKTKKYIKQSAILGVFIGLNLVFGMNPLMYIVLATMILFLTERLDKTHISFPKKMMSSISQSSRENLYKVERININKLLVSLVIVILISIATFYCFGLAINTVESKIIDNEIMNILISNLNANNISNINHDVKENLVNILSSGNEFLMTSKTYYMVFFGYIVFIELLSVLLKRRYDTKSTVMKLIFVLTFICMAIFDVNLYLYQPLLTTLLTLIAIVNTSNIYLNREERIKMLVA